MATASPGPFAWPHRLRNTEIPFEANAGNTSKMHSCVMVAATTYEGGPQGSVVDFVHRRVRSLASLDGMEQETRRIKEYGDRALRPRWPEDLSKSLTMSKERSMGQRTSSSAWRAREFGIKITGAVRSRIEHYKVSNLARTLDEATRSEI